MLHWLYDGRLLAVKWMQSVLDEGEAPAMKDDSPGKLYRSLKWRRSTFDSFSIVRVMIIIIHISTLRSIVLSVTNLDYLKHIESFERIFQIMLAT